MTDDEIGVLTANDSFYDAFAAHDIARMDGIWSRRAPVSCIHPGWSPLVGRDPVMASWRAILHGDETSIQPRAARAFMTGDSAYVICFESAGAGPPGLVATNIFVREDGEWKIAHHQAGPVASPPDVAPTTPTN
jgi:ketosteroid isomerase-like protein